MFGDESDRPEYRQLTPPPMEGASLQAPLSQLQEMPVLKPLRESLQSDSHDFVARELLKLESEARDRVCSTETDAALRAPYEEFENDSPEVRRLLRLWNTVYNMY